MNALKKWSTKSRLSFIIFAVFLSLFLFLQGQIWQLDAAGKAHPTNKENEYPATPEGVVENEHRKQYECNFPGESYFLEESECMADYGIVVSSFAVKKLIQSESRARIMVEFDVVGTFHPGFITQKEDDGNTLTKTKSDGYHGFDVFKTKDGKYDYGVIYYDLVRKKDKWKIVPKWKGCPVLYMSIGAAIKFIEDEMKFIKDDSIKIRNLKIINYLKNLQKADKLGGQ
jgi:hypothetical protein